MEISKLTDGFVGKAATLVGGIIVFAIVGLVGFRMLFVNFVDNYEVGYKYTKVGEGKGKIEILKEKGWIITPPFIVKVHTIDMRPMQVCINANQRVLNCKLVQFNPEGIELFLSWHGRNDYEGPSSGARDASPTTAFSEILKSYAYEGSGKIYQFLTVVRELKPEETQ